MKCMRAGHTVMKAKEDMVGTIIKNICQATEYKPQPPSKSVVKPSSDTRSKIECMLAKLSVVTKPALRPIQRVISIRPMAS